MKIGDKVYWKSESGKVIGGVIYGIYPKIEGYNQLYVSPDDPSLECEYIEDYNCIPLSEEEKDLVTLENYKYKIKYNNLVEAIRELGELNPSDEGIQNWINDNVPELKKVWLQ